MDCSVAAGWLCCLVWECLENSYSCFKAFLPFPLDPSFNYFILYSMQGRLCSAPQPLLGFSENPKSVSTRTPAQTQSRTP